MSRAQASKLAGYEQTLIDALRGHKVAGHFNATVQVAHLSAINDDQIHNDYKVSHYGIM